MGAFARRFFGVGLLDTSQDFLKMLNRHLMTSYGMTPEAYRARWGLKADYPMVAPSYAKKRQELALKIGLGRKKAAVAPTPKGKRAKAAA